MRVITGLARGKKLRTLAGNDVRPTTDMVKEAVFSTIQFEIENSRVLDLFAGSGQLGIEALSRGAKEAVFCDNSREAINVVKDNLSSCSLSDKAVVLQTDYETFLMRNSEAFDICFLDPPYSAGYYEKALNLLSYNIKAQGKVLCEHPVSLKLNERYGNLKKQKEYRFSKIAVTKYIMEVEDDE